MTVSDDGAERAIERAIDDLADRMTYADINAAAELPPGSLGRIAAERRCTSVDTCPVPWHNHGESARE